MEDTGTYTAYMYQKCLKKKKTFDERDGKGRSGKVHVSQYLISHLLDNGSLIYYLRQLHRWSLQLYTGPVVSSTIPTFPTFSCSHVFPSYCQSSPIRFSIFDLIPHPWMFSGVHTYTLLGRYF